MKKRYKTFYNECLKKFMRLQVIVLLLLAAYSITNLIYPYFLKLIIDDAITNKDLTKLIRYTVLLFLTIVCSLGFRYGKSLFSFYFAKKISTDIKQTIISKIFNYNLNFFRNYKIGEIVSIVEQDVMNIQNMFMSIFSGMIVNVITFIGLSVILCSLSWKLAIVSFGLSIIYVFYQRTFGKRLKEISYKLSIQRGEFQAISQELFLNLPVIKLHSGDEFFKDKYASCQKEFFDTLYIGTRIRAKANIIDGIFEGLNLLIVLSMGGYLVLKEQLTVGALFTISLYVQKIITPIVSLMDEYIELRKVQASVDRVCEILDSNQYQIKLGVCNRYEDFDLSIENMSFSYNKKVIFQNIMTSIPQGDKVVIMGQNGSGKTTLMNILLKLEGNYEGRICLGKNEISEFDNTFYKKILYVKQESFIFNGTIIENLLMGNKGVSEERLHKVLEMMNLKEDIESLEHGIYSVIGEKGIKLSGGQRQKIALARTFFLREYSIIILDEPTAALDIESEKIILDNIFKENENKTIIVISHRRKVLEYCKRVLEIRDNLIHFHWESPNS